MTQRNVSNWAAEVEFGELYEEFNEHDDIFEVAHQAINNFKRKQQKRSKLTKKLKICWQ